MSVKSYLNSAGVRSSYEEPRSISKLVDSRSDSKESTPTRTKKSTKSEGERKHERVKKKKKHCHDVDCARCGYPCKKKSSKKSPKCVSLANIDRSEYHIRTDIKISEVGSIPVLKGDPKWLPLHVQNFIAAKARLMRPAAIYICNGSVFEADEMLEVLQNQGIVQPLSAYTNVHLARTDPADTARVESATWICHKDRAVVESKRDSPDSCDFARFMSMNRLERELDGRFPGCMRGRVMYVIPFCMGPIAGRYSRYAVQLTDSPYVVVNMRLMARVSSSIWDAIGTGPFVKCIHSVGVPRPVTRVLRNNWPCLPDRYLIAHSMEEQEVWSFGSGYGGNSLLGKKVLALRFGSFMGKKEGWLAEHATVLSITNPAGEESFICVSAPSGGGKTVLALSTPALEGWKVKVLGDDIAWIRVGDDGRMYASNPENGMFGIACGISEQTMPVAVQMLKKNCLLVNTASTSSGKMFWKELENTLQNGETVTDWKGQPWTAQSKNPPAHPNSRFTTTIDQCPTAHELWDSPKGVPLTAYIFLSKRPDAFPLVMESESWTHGVTMAAGMRSVAGSGTDKKGQGLIHDPMGMRAFLSYNFADYVKHWLSFEKKVAKPPKIFHANWYRTDKEGKLLWPGYGQNIRILQWVLDRCSGKETTADKVPGGFIPTKINTEGLSTDPAPALAFDKEFWSSEIDEMKSFFEAEMSSETPEECKTVLENLKKELKD